MTANDRLRHRASVWTLRTALLGTALGVLACGEQTKVKECNALVAVINKGVDEVQRDTRVAADAGPGAKNLQQLADTMDRFGADAAKVKLTSDELQKLAKQYHSMTGEIATAARELAAAYKKVDEEGMRSAQAKMEKAVQQEEPLVESINKFCRAP